MRLSYLYIYILTLFALLPTTLPAQGNKEKVRVYGKITDAATNESMPYTSVRIRNTSNGCSSDNNGNFSFFVNALRDTLIVSSVGYAEKRIPLNYKTRMPLRIKLKPTDYSLGEVTIKPKNEKYRKKDNPAVTLARNIIKRRNDNSPANKPFYSRNRHEKLNLALNNFDSSNNNRFGKSFGFLEQYIDTSLISGEPILYISAREIIATDYYKKDPERERKHIKARKRDGIDDMFSTGETEALYEEAFKDVDIFRDNISLFGNKFVSPLSNIGTTFYRYYLMDTIEIDGEKCIDLAFSPFNTESFGFTGHLFVTCDSTFFIKSVQMNIPHDINMNFIEYMNIKQDFERLPDSTRLLKNESLVCEMKIVNAVNGLYASRQVAYDNYSFESNEFAEAILDNPSPQIENENSMHMTDEFWAKNRLNEVSEKEQSVKKMMTELRNNKTYYWIEKGVAFLFTGWVPIRDNEPPVFYGPVNTTLSHNELEGLRIRGGAMTSAYLNPYVFGNFFVAYGMKDNKLKYKGELEFSFKKKREHPNEFPIHSIRLSYLHDTYQYGQNYLYTNKDNMFLSIKRKSDNKIGYIRNAEATYKKEFYNHFSFGLTLRNRIDIASHLIPFTQTVTIDGNTITNEVKNLKRSEIEVELRYAPNEKFTQTKWNRHSILPEHPVYTLKHTIGLKNVLGSSLNYHHTEASFNKRFWFSAFGYTDCILKAGKVWNKVPFPLLIMPNANLSYTIQKESYALMNAMEFFNDEYASWDLSYYMNGLIFNRLPLIRKLNWREVITFKGMYGNLSEKNRPDPENTGTLYKFPYENDQYHFLGKEPYMELSVGIENIFRVLRVDYVRRMTYRDLPGIDKWGIRIQFHIQF